MSRSPLVRFGLSLGFLVAAAPRALAQTAPPPPPGQYPAYTPPPGAYPYAPPPGYGYPPPPPPPSGPPPVTPEKHLGIGYKIGNGVGFVGGDVVIAPVPHLALDLQANYLSAQVSDGFSSRTATGWAVAPSVQGRLYSGQVNTPYVGLGFVHLALTLDNVTANVNGFFMNLGWEWRWDSGLGILLGGGFAHVTSAHATDGVTSISRGSATMPNLEVGLRYMFL
jgi:hypothetical protein